MRVLITGAAGQLGRELTDRFGKGDHHEVIATDRTNLDLESRDSILGAITSASPDVVVHSGAWTAVDHCEGDLDKALKVNALATRHVAEAARIVDSRVIYVSTDYVFDGELDRPYDEWDRPNPQSVYGRSKLGGEMELDEVDTIVRTSWVFGRHGNNMVKTVLRLMQSHPELSFVDDQIGHPTSAEDLADTIYLLAVEKLPGLFHATNQTATSWYGFVQAVLEAAGESPDRVKPISTAELVPARPAPRPKNSVLDNAALRLQGVPLMSDYRVSLDRLVKELLTQ